MIDRMREFFEMGGYALYVWPAWGLALVILGGLAIAAHRSRRAAREALAEIASSEIGRA
jgi:heme exporter protein D